MAIDVFNESAVPGSVNNALQGSVNNVRGSFSPDNLTIWGICGAGGAGFTGSGVVDFDALGAASAAGPLTSPTGIWTSGGSGATNGSNQIYYGYTLNGNPYSPLNPPFLSGPQEYFILGTATDYTDGEYNGESCIFTFPGSPLALPGTINPAIGCTLTTSTVTSQQSLPFGLYAVSMGFGQNASPYVIPTFGSGGGVGMADGISQLTLQIVAADNGQVVTIPIATNPHSPVLYPSDPFGTYNGYTTNIDTTALFGRTCSFYPRLIFCCIGQGQAIFGGSGTSMLGGIAAASFLRVP